MDSRLKATVRCCAQRVIGLPMEKHMESLSSTTGFFLHLDYCFGKILTTDNLRGRGIAVMDWCCSCKAINESVNHLFLHCPMAHELGTLIFFLFGISWVLPSSVADLFARWKGNLGTQATGEIWKSIPLCLMGHIWKERNKHTIEGTEWLVQEVKFLLLRSLFEWRSIPTPFF